MPRGEGVEYIDTSSNPEPRSTQLPAEVRATGQLRVQFVEESKAEAFMTAKVDNPEVKRVQIAEQLRKSKRQELISKKTQAHGPGQFLVGDV